MSDRMGVRDVIRSSPLHGVTKGFGTEPFIEIRRFKPLDLSRIDVRNRHNSTKAIQTGETIVKDTVTALKSQSFPLDDVSLKDCYRALEGPVVYWSEPGHPPVIGGGIAAEIKASGPDRFRTLKDEAESLYAHLSEPENVDESSPTTAEPRFFGGIAFTPSIGEREWQSFGAAQFRLPAVQLTESAGRTWLTINAQSEQRIKQKRDNLLDAINEESPDHSHRHIEHISQYPERQQWLRHVHEILRLIRKGPLEKLVLAQKMNVRFDRPLNTPFLFSALDSAPRNTHRFLVENGHGKKFLGASPETLVDRRKNTVKTESLAGTIESGQTSRETEDLAQQLAENPKNQKEHDFVLNTIRRRLEQHVETVDTGDQTVRRFPSVQHLYTPVEATLEDDTHVLTLTETLHPTPAVGGNPEEEYEQYRSQFEPFERGWYASPIGWFNANGDGHFAVAIRSALVEDREATLFAGAGLVNDSQPEKEWDEVQWKYQSLLDVLQQ